MKQLVEELISLYEFKGNLIRKLGDCPQNPNIRKISNSPRAFVINIKSIDVGESLLPGYYDNEMLIREIIKLVEKENSPNSIKNILKQIANEGKYRVKRGHVIKFNKYVRDHILTLL